ncbi:MAG: MAPEG family protein [Bauldia sp.]|uniref:MAPEG family protein n=1 Tax=Bauldia sp. TaxID=2575872 RepID=UPI001DFB2CD0|nr:MAPEG family protein [Bauldia sp.]MCB1497449.1 MAPEG family protein [Bauldia sp.]
MSPTTAFAPLFLQVALTFVLLFRLGQLRLRLVRAGSVNLRDYALGADVWPAGANNVANAFRSQFELPVLFYVVTVLAFMSGRMSTGLLVLSWVFVASRLFHALIFVTTNNIPRRFAVFTGGFLALVAMWLVFFADLATDL